MTTRLGETIDNVGAGSITPFTKYTRKPSHDLSETIQTAKFAKQGKLIAGSLADEVGMYELLLDGSSKPFVPALVPP